MAKGKRVNGLKGSTKHKTDPDPLVIVGLVIAGLAATGGLIDGLVGLANRFDVNKANARSTKAKLSKWGHAVKTLRREIEGFSSFCDRVSPRAKEDSVVGQSFLLEHSDVLQYKSYVATLGGLARDATNLSIDLIATMEGADQNRMSWAPSRLDGIQRVLAKASALTDGVNASDRVGWGAATLGDFLERALTQVKMLEAFEPELQKLLRPK